MNLADIDLGTVLYAGAAGLIILGLYGMTASRHVMRIIIGLAILESGINLLLVAIGFRADAAAPILAGEASAPGAVLVDPLPQALVLTAIVIGAGVLALALALVVRVHQTCGVLDMKQLGDLIAQTSETSERNSEAPTPATNPAPDKTAAEPAA